MKRIITLLSPWLFITFAACGGGDKQQDPPPPATSPAGQQTLQDIRGQVQRANQDCSDSFSPLILLALSAKNQGAQNPALLGLLGQGNTGGCSNSLLNILLQAKTVDNGNWINNTPGSKEWLAGQIAGVISRVGAKVQSQGGNIQQAMTLPWNQYVNGTFLPQMGQPGLASTVNQYLH